MSGPGYRKLRNSTRTIAGIDLAVEADDSSRNDLVPARIHHVFFDVMQPLALLVFFDPANLQFELPITNADLKD
jgi:hypothetical protein